MMSSPESGPMADDQQQYSPKSELEARQSYVDCSQGIVRVPMGSAGTRKLSKRSRQSSRGGIPYFSQKLQKYVTLKTESHLEGACHYVAMADPNVVHIWDQPKPVKYYEWDGRKAEYTADALIEYRSGFKILVETKPSAIAIKRQTELKLTRVAEFVPVDFANQVTLFTEKSCPKWLVADARRLHEFQKHPDPEADDAIREVIDRLSGTTTLGALAGKTGLAGRGFRAAFRAVFRGDIQRANAGALSASSSVFKAEAAA